MNSQLPDVIAESKEQTAGPVITDTTAATCLHQSSGKSRRRLLQNQVAGLIIPLGGIGVILTLLLLFVFLLFEVLPLFRSASLELFTEFSLPTPANVQTLHLAAMEQGSIGFRLTDDGTASFIDLASGRLISQEKLPLAEDDVITDFTTTMGNGTLMAVGLASGKALVFVRQYRTDFSTENKTRTITPFLVYPLGRNPIALGSKGIPTSLAVAGQDDSIMLAAWDPTGHIRVLHAKRERDLMSTIDPAASSAYEIYTSSFNEETSGDEQRILIDSTLRHLWFLSESGQLRAYDLKQLFAGNSSAVDFTLGITEPNLSAAQWLPGADSLLLPDSVGRIHQFFLNGIDANNPLLPARVFTVSNQSLATLVSERRAKNFISIDQQGFLRAFNATSNRETYSVQVSAGAPLAMAVAPRGNLLVLEIKPNRFSVWRIDNPHPEISWTALWGKIWYEGYAEPDYIWQSSGTGNSSEPKYSLVPLSFGTLKAAFYAMLLAAPLALCGAIYSGYFMASALRRKVRPTIELMEALPTVVLGFLAGLWFAPVFEQHLLAVFNILVILPFSILLTSLGWSLLPGNIRQSLPDGWVVVLLLPVILLAGWLSFVVSTPVEIMFFAGDFRSWLSRELGLDYVQRNAMVIGIAMGFAVIPTIFAIAEDAISSVPRHLSYGSLALGATPWQSLYQVILPTASPGLCSALLVGLGRALGETMIVLMATGNTPIMDFDLFDGMRTLAANIAIEIPESAVDSTHYRILFLAAMVLFLFTFFINTVAELVHQRLRQRYSGL